MSPDDKLSDLLRRGPAPPAALDATRREAVLAQARQAWFRERAARRRWRWGAAAAACLAVGLAAWAVSVDSGGSYTAPAQPIVTSARELRRAEEPSDRRNAAPVIAPAPAEPQLREAAKDLAAADKAERDAAPQAMAKAAPAADAAMEAGAPTAAAAAPSPARPPTAPPPPPVATAPAFSPPAPGAAAEAGAGLALRAPAANRAARADAQTAAAVEPAKPAEDQPETRLVPADAPERGKLLAAAAVVHAARTGVLDPAERAAALQAAADLIVRIRHPAADELRRRIAVEMRKR